MNAFLRYLTGALLGCCLFPGCNSGSAEDGDFVGACPVGLVQRPQVAEPAKVKIFLETSGSMFGFMPSKKATAFQKDVYNIVSAWNDAWPDKLSFYQLAQQGRPAIAWSFTAFRAKMNSGAFQSASSTEIPQMLDTILARRRPNEVAVLVSDLIFSPEAKGNAAPALEQITTDIRSRFYHRDVASILFHLNSVFWGQRVHPAASPYYVWLMGKPDQLGAAAALLRKRYPGIDQANFGVPDVGMKGTVLPGYGADGHATPVICTKDKVYACLSDYDGEPAGFAVALNLSNWPDYMQEPAYLRRHLRVSGDQGQVTLGSVGRLSDETKLPTTDRALAERLGATHVLRLAVRNQFADDMRIHFTLSRTLPAWVSALNADRDDPERKLTFGLGRLTQGLGEAFSDPPTVVLPFTIKISKNSLD